MLVPQHNTIVLYAVALFCRSLFCAGRFIWMGPQSDILNFLLNSSFISVNYIHNVW